MTLIDSHCHLLHGKFAEDPAMTPAQLVSDARAAGVGKLITIACARDEWAPALAFAAGEEGVFVGAGIHPHHAGEGGVITEGELRELAANSQVVGLGETGLDYYYDSAPQAAQQECFNVHLNVAREVGLPVIVHTRDAEEDTLAILREHTGVPFVLHCFTGSRKMAEAAVELGGYISFSGVLTFKKSDDLRAIAAALPHDRVLVETDAPYLAPEPNRGRRCAPAMVAYTARCLAEVWGVSEGEAAALTTANAERLFPRLV